MIYTTNIFALPIIALLAVVDTYLLLVGARLIAGRIAGTSRFYCCLQQLTDGIPHRVDKLIASQRKRPHPGWLSWTVVISACIVARHFLILFLLTL